MCLALRQRTFRVADTDQIAPRGISPQERCASTFGAVACALGTGATSTSQVRANTPPAASAADIIGIRPRAVMFLLLDRARQSYRCRSRTDRGTEPPKACSEARSVADERNRSSPYIGRRPKPFSPPD